MIVEEKIAIMMRIVRDQQDDQIQETDRQKNWPDHEIDHQSELDQNQFEIVPDHLIENRSRKLSRKSRNVENGLILAMKMSTENRKKRKRKIEVQKVEKRVRMIF